MPAREGAPDAKKRHRGGDRIQGKQGVVTCEGQSDPDQPGKVAGALQKPKPGLEGVRDAKPNGAQLPPP
jgi:hypothetical protein